MGDVTFNPQPARRVTAFLAAFIPQGVRRTAALLVAFLVLLLPRVAEAYPWFMRHGYTTCAPCHADPSGAGLLTQYGRAQGELLLRTRYGGEPDDEPGQLKDFLFFWETPPALLLGGSLRTGLLHTQASGANDTRVLGMQYDLRGQVKVGRFRANGGVGYLPRSGGSTQLTSRDEHNLVSREYWVGADLGESEEFLLRVGRMALPYGLRGNEHTFWSRSLVRNDIDRHQQFGAAFAYSGEKARAEVMVYLGNLQVNPSTYWEQGASGYFEWAFDPKFAGGVSALLAYSGLDTQLRAPLQRQAYGVFARAVVAKPVVLLGEADLLVQSVGDRSYDVGGVGFLTTDVEIVQGVHGLLTGELQARPGESGLGAGGWFGANWFFLPHTDLRFDTIVRNVPTTAAGGAPTRTTTVSLLAQLHVYL